MTHDNTGPEVNSASAGPDCGTDKSEQHERIAQALRESEKRLRDFAIATSDWFWETDAEHRFTWFSENVEIITGMSRQWHYGKTRAEMVDADTDPRAWQTHLATLAAHKPYRDFEFFRRGPDGGRWIRSSGVPVFDDHGQFQGYRGTGTDVTALREARDRAQTAQTRFMKAIDIFSGSFALYDADDRLVICDRKYRDIHQPIVISPGLPFEDLMRAQLRHGMIIDATGREKQWLAGRLAHFRHPRGLLEVQRIGGRWLQIHEERMPDGSLFMSGLDITEQKHAEMALRESEERFRLLVEGSIQGIYIQRDWKLQFVNQAMAAMLGYRSTAELLAIDSLDVFIAPHERARLRRYNSDRCAGREAPTQYEYAAVRKDGAALVLQNMATLINWQGAPAVQITVIDITERKHSELQLQQARDELELQVAARTRELLDTNARLNREIDERERAERALREERELLTQRVEERTGALRAANEELADAARAKDEFLASMSHELRTPLNAILGLSEILQQDLDAALTEQQRYLQTIQDSGRHLLALINDILDIARARTGEFQLDITDVAIDALCQASLLLIRQAASQKRHRIATRIDSSVTFIRADERRLKQILVNLLSNAVKFTPAGGEIGLQVEAEADGVRFIVWDSGIGIAEDAMKHLFKPFVQLDNRFSREHSGSGLGLSLVYHMVEMHGGSVSVESDLGQGSRFSVFLPWTGGDSAEIEPPASVMPEATMAPTDALAEPLKRALIIRLPADAGADAETSRSALILLAEDNESNILTLSGYLQTSGYRLAVARDGSEAIQRAREIVPDLILMDIQMPGMDGLEAIRRLRNDATLAPIPIIALTALAMPDDRQRCLNAGASDYLSKPVSRSHLLEAIASQLRSTCSL